jgi:RNA polymerase sigma-70 factor, ECF subfamily
MLFQRILQNTIRDYYRRQRVRSRWISLTSSLLPQDGDAEYDPVEETLQDKNNASQGLSPDASFEQSQLIVLIEEALVSLPIRQREAFLLRYWEGMDTAETASIMGCTEGSVKTHCSRATHALAAILKIKGVSLS